MAKKTNWRILIVILLGLVLTCYSAPNSQGQNQKAEMDSELVIVSGETNRTLTTQQMSQALPKAKVTVTDPVYGKAKTYEGFWLEDVLKLAGVPLDTENVIVFSALDGYQARLSHLRIPGAKPLLATRDLDQPTGWEVFMHGKEKSTPGPFYLVWQISAAAKPEGLPWPYQINRIEVRNAQESQRQLSPNQTEAKASPEVMRGFNQFTKSCLSCHSINLEGGVLGPELNVPKNITEYRESAYLIEFIKDPSSFRAKSKMPAFKDALSDEAIGDVLSYLKAMRKHKVRLSK